MAKIINLSLYSHINIHQLPHNRYGKLMLKHVWLTCEKPMRLILVCKAGSVGKTRA